MTGTIEQETVIVLRHKADGKASSKATKAAKAASTEALRVARVRRPGLEEFLFSGAFHAMPMIQQAVIDNPFRLWDEYADEGTYFVIPEDSLGRSPKGRARDMDSTCQSILLWIKKYFGETSPALVRSSELSLTVVTFD